MLSVLRRLIVDEVRRGLQVPWVRAAIILLAVGGWFTVRFGERELREQRATHAELIQARLQSQQHAVYATGHVAEPGLRAIRPPNDGIMFVPGADSALPAAWEFTPAGPEAMFSYAINRQVQAGTVDLEFLTRVFGSLVALGLGLITVTTDRRTGWIGTLRGLPVPATVLSLARILGGCLTLAVVVSVWWLSMSGAAWFGATSATDSLMRLWPLALVSWMSLCLFFGLGTACAWADPMGGGRAALVGVAVWAGTTVLGPVLVTAIAEGVVPVAPQIRMERERREQYADAMRAAEETTARHLSEKLPDGITVAEARIPAESEFPAVEPEWQRLAQDARTAATELQDHWQNQMQAQRRLASWAAWLSPGTLVREALAELAGTGQHVNDAWKLAVHRQQIALDSALFDDLPGVNLRVPVGRQISWMLFPRHQAPKFGELPALQPPEQSWLMRWSDATTLLVGLLLWTLGALGAAHWLGSRTLHTSS